VAQAIVRTVRQCEPVVRLFVSDGSERSTYMPQAKAIELLGAVHSGVNLMSCYYPGQSFWPERRLFGPEVPHFRHSPKDEWGETRLQDPNEWTDGYYSLDIEDPENEVLRQIQDVRRHGQDVRLTLTADIDTPDADLERIADVLSDYGRMQLRLNHEANGCTWFRFARNVGENRGEERRRLYYEISQFFIRAHHLFGSVAPNVQFVACYNGPGERAMRGEVGAGELPALGRDELGLMYLLPGIVVSLDQYGSLHYGWPGHKIEDPPVTGPVEAAEHQAFALTPETLCEGIERPFQQAISRMRGEQTRIDLGELNFDEDIHGPQIQSHMVHQAYRWIRANPETVGSVTFYELTDRGGLGLFRQRAYGDLEELETTILLEVYRDIMSWPEFQPRRRVTSEVEPGADSVRLEWRSAVDADGLELLPEEPAGGIDFKESYWRRVQLDHPDGSRQLLHTDRREVGLNGPVESVKVFALPPDGRDNCPTGYERSVPVPDLL
jgi:hypothetical protein